MDRLRAKLVFLANRGENILSNFKKSSKVNRTGKLWYLFLSIKLLLLAKSYILKGDFALGYMSTQVWDFSNIFQFPNCEAVLQLEWQFVCNFFYPRYQVQFYLWQIEPILKHIKLPNSHDLARLKNFHLHFIFSAMVSTSEHSSTFQKKKKCIEPLPRRFLIRRRKNWIFVVYVPF